MQLVKFLFRRRQYQPARASVQFSDREPGASALRLIRLTAKIRWFAFSDPAAAWNSYDKAGKAGSRSLKMCDSIRRTLAWVICVTVLQSTAALADDDALRTLLERLNDDERKVAAAAIYNLDSKRLIQDRRVIARLVELSGDEDPDLRESICNRFAMAGPAAKFALPAIRNRMKDDSLQVRIAAAEAIWRVAGDRRAAANLLVDVLGRGDEDETYAAAVALQRMGVEAKSVLPQLVERITDKRADVRAHVVETMGEFGPASRELLVPPLQRALADEDSLVRMEAAVALHRVDGPLDAAIETLIAMVKNEPEPTEKNRNSIWGGGGSANGAIHALGQMRGDAAAATPTLSASLESPILSIRMGAAESLGHIGPAAAPAIAPLAKAMRETEFHSVPFVHRAFSVSENATNALIQIGVDSTDVLIEALSDKDVIVRTNAARALGAIPDGLDKSMKPLIGALADKHPLVRIEAAKACARLYRGAQPAIPALTRLLVDDRAYTSFRGGMGIGDKESVRDEALKALILIDPAAQQVAPTLVETLRSAKEVSYEAIYMLRRFSDSMAAAKAPLVKLLNEDKARVEAAAALAVVAPRHPELEKILVSGLIVPKSGDEEEDSFNAIAAMGLGELAARGVELQPESHQKLVAIAERRRSQFVLASLLKIQPTRKNADALVDALRTAHWVFEATGMIEAKATLQRYAKRPAVQQALVAGALFNPTEADEPDAHHRKNLRDRGRLQAVTILVNARIEHPVVLESIRGLAANADEDVQGDVADLLPRAAVAKEEAIEILIAILDNEGRYVVDGDFYGNGGEMRVAGERAARALAALRASDALRSRLADPQAGVRRRVVRTLGRIGADGVSPQLLALVDDANPQVRLELMRALGRIAKAQNGGDAEIRVALEKGRQDRRRSVRDAASRSLRDMKK